VRDQIQHFGSFATVTQGQYEVSSDHDAEVAVQRILAIEQHCWRPGTIEGGNDFGGDVFGFPDTKNDNLSFAIEGIPESDYNLRETAVDPLFQPEQLLYLSAHNSLPGRNDINFSVWIYSRSQGLIRPVVTG
jgi:hypothetical protein